MRSGPIILIEDDGDDKYLMEEALAALQIPNKLIWFDNCAEALRYLITATEQPFLILSDINLPGQSGIEFKRDLDNDIRLRKKSIPFLFYSTAVNQFIIDQAYTEMTVQGFFQKPDSFSELKNSLKLIVDYWKLCKHPNAL